MADALALLLADLRQHPRQDPADARVRLAIRLRARDACEYCLLPTGGQFQIDHIIPPARWPAYIAGRLPAVAGRGGPDHLDNFAWACPFCNQRKGQSVTATVGGRTTRLYDPRANAWPAHFALVRHGIIIVGLDMVGVATERTLGFNVGGLDGPLAARADEVLAGSYPPPWARLARPDRTGRGVGRAAASAGIMQLTGAKEAADYRTDFEHRAPRGALDRLQAALATADPAGELESAASRPMDFGVQPGAALRCRSQSLTVRLEPGQHLVVDRHGHARAWQTHGRPRKSGPVVEYFGRDTVP